MTTAAALKGCEVARAERWRSGRYAAFQRYSEKHNSINIHFLCL